jgi:hypothetical protein
LSSGREHLHLCRVFCRPGFFVVGWLVG